ncbi:MAG: amidohydrolase family protein [Candidatus Poribacteria bacterium]|nr:amidohydrolase family protein [Candidatus Poribacteria bacterium]
MEKIDVHVHVFDKLSAAFPRKVNRLAPAEREARAEQLLQEMDAAGIAKTVLIGYGGTGIEHHRYATQCVERWPHRFTAAGLVDVNDPDPPARLRELYEATGIEGIRLRANLGDPTSERLEDLKAYRLFQCADELGININIYTESSQVPCIEMLVRAFPGVPVSLDHLGISPSTSLVADRWRRPRFDEEPLPPETYPKIIDLAKYPNVYIKVSGEYAFSKTPYPYADMKPMVEQIYRAYGPERMMWGTDFPWIVSEPGYQRLVALIDYHLPDLSKAEREMIMGGTAKTIWFKRKSKEVE